MRVLHLDTERTWRGGEQQVTYLVEGLARRGVQSTLVAPPDSEIARRFTESGWDVCPVTMRGEGDVGAMMRVTSCIRSRGADLLHAHTSHAHSIGAIAARMAGVPSVISRRVDFGVTGLSRIKYQRLGTQYIAITHAVADVLRRAGVDDAKLNIVPSGIALSRVADASRVRGRHALKLDAEVPVVGTVAHFAWHKGLPTLIRAWPEVRAAVPDAQLVLVGQGEDEALLRGEVQAASVVDSVHFAGFRDDVPDCLAAFDVFTLPSVMEGMGTSILDALALERPVVASAVGGIPEVIESERCGLLVPPSDPAALARALCRLLLEPEWAAALGRAGRQRVEAEFTADRMAEGTVEVYHRLLSAAAS